MTPRWSGIGDVGAPGVGLAGAGVFREFDADDVRCVDINASPSFDLRIASVVLSVVYLLQVDLPGCRGRPDARLIREKAHNLFALSGVDPHPETSLSPEPETGVIPHGRMPDES